jgi:hypothetical protein
MKLSKSNKDCGSTTQLNAQPSAAGGDSSARQEPRMCAVRLEDFVSHMSGYVCAWWVPGAHQTQLNAQPSAAGGDSSARQEQWMCAVRPEDFVSHMSGYVFAWWMPGIPLFLQIVMWTELLSCGPHHVIKAQLFVLVLETADW